MNCNFSLKVYESRHDIASGLVDEFFRIKDAKKKEGKVLNAAFSGGRTPVFFFKALGNMAESSGDDLSGVRFFWVDERCVAPDSEESNFGQFDSLVLSRLKVPERNIFRIMGEMQPEEEVKRYDALLRNTLPLVNNFPVFDFMLLGVGRDGHTASLFPMSKQLYEQEKAVVVSESPDTGRKRITLTLPVICNAERIIFLVTGADKRDIVRILYKHDREDPLFPASFVKTGKGNIEWYVDSEAWSPWPTDSD